MVGDLRDERDVLTRGETRDQIIELEYEPDVLAAIRRERAIAGSHQVVVAKPDDAARWRVEAAEDVEKRRLAAAGRPENDDELALEEVEIDALESGHSDLAH